MKMYVEVDNRLIKDDKDDKKVIKETKNNVIQPDSKSILESYGLSKNARILTE